MTRVFAFNNHLRNFRFVISLMITIFLANQCCSGAEFKGNRVIVTGDLSEEKAHYYVGLCDSFLGYIDHNFCRLTGQYPMRACIFHDQATYNKYVLEVLHQPIPAYYGMYIGRLNTFLSWDGAGIGTMTHEIMHKVCIDQGLIQEKWAHEGIPTFFEKLYGYEDAGQLVVSMGYQNPWRIKQMGAKILEQNLSDIISRATAGGEDESAQRLVSVFLYQHAALKKYCDLSISRRKHGFSTYLEAALGKTFKQIEPEWVEYIRTIYKNKPLIEKLPGSQIFLNKKDLERYAVENNIPIRWTQF